MKTHRLTQIACFASLLAVCCSGCSWSKKFLRGPEMGQPVDPAFLMEDEQAGTQLTSNDADADYDATIGLAPPQVSLTTGGKSPPTATPSATPTGTPARTPTVGSVASTSPSSQYAGSSQQHTNFHQNFEGPDAMGSNMNRADGLTYGQTRSLAAASTNQAGFDGSFTGVFDEHYRPQQATSGVNAPAAYQSLTPMSHVPQYPAAPNARPQSPGGRSLSSTQAGGWQPTSETTNRYRASPPGGNAPKPGVLSAHQGTTQKPPPQPSLPAAPGAPIPPKQTVLPPQVHIQVAGVRPGEGPVRIALFESPQTFPEQDLAAAKQAIEPTNTIVQVAFAVSPNRAAVAAYQDINGDGKLNQNRFGVPTEPYGFSGGARRRRGPPSFDDAASKMLAGTVHQIQLR